MKKTCALTLNHRKSWLTIPMDIPNYIPISLSTIPMKPLKLTFGTPFSGMTKFIFCQKIICFVPSSNCML